MLFPADPLFSCPYSKYIFADTANVFSQVTQTYFWMFCRYIFARFSYVRFLLQNFRISWAIKTLKNDPICSSCYSWFLTLVAQLVLSNVSNCHLSDECVRLLQSPKTAFIISSQFICVSICTIWILQVVLKAACICSPTKLPVLYLVGAREITAVARN